MELNFPGSCADKGFRGEDSPKISYSMDSSLTITKSSAKDTDQLKELKYVFLSSLNHEIRTPLNGILGLTDLLLESGANIHEINAVRKHISEIKGGQLARLAYPATVISLLLSDVIGDDLDVIGSGPTAPDASTFDSVAAILRKYKIYDRVPEAVRARIERGLRGEIAETPKAGDEMLSRTQNLVVGSNVSTEIIGERRYKLKEWLIAAISP